MNAMHTGSPQQAPAPSEAEDRFTSEGGSVGPRHPPEDQNASVMASVRRRVDQAVAPESPPSTPRASGTPTPRQMALMRDLNVDFSHGTYQYRQVRFTGFEEAIDHAETSRRTSARDDK